MPDDCYWIEVKFSDRETLRKESKRLNDIYEVYGQYSAKTRRNKNVEEIVAGRGEDFQSVMLG